jgi:hypothetical protein
MTFQFSANNTYVGKGLISNPTGDQAWFTFKEFMKTNGWTVVQSSDGTTASSSADVITTSASGAGGMANASTWFVLKEPSGGLAGKRREFLFIRTNSVADAVIGMNRLVAYSVQGFSTTLGWNNAAVSATNPPIAFDMAIHNTTPATLAFSTSPTFTDADILRIGEATNIWDMHIGVDNAAPHGWFMFATFRGTGALNTSWFMCFDPLTSYDSLDSDPTVWHIFTVNNTIINPNLNNGSAGAQSLSWWKYTAFSDKTDATNKIGANACAYVRATFLKDTNNHSLSTDPNSGKDVLYPVSFSQTSPVGSIVSFKGFSSILRYATHLRQNAETLTVSSSKDYLLVGCSTTSEGAIFAVPWGGATPNS